MFVCKKQSRMSCSQCHLKFQPKCLYSDYSGVMCNSCNFIKNIQDGADRDQQKNVHHYDIPEFNDLASKKGLKILHQNIRGLLANKSNICHILGGFKNILIFPSVKHVYPPESEAEVQIEGYTFIVK